MKTPNSSENQNFLSRFITCLSTLLSFNNTNCCQSRVDGGRMVVVKAKENPHDGSGKGEEPPTILVPELTSQPVSTSVELTPPTQNWMFPTKGVEFVGNEEGGPVKNEGDNSVINKRKEFIELHNQLFPASNSSSSTRGLYTPASSPQPLTQRSHSLIFTKGPGGERVIFAG